MNIKKKHIKILYNNLHCSLISEMATPGARRVNRSNERKWQDWLNRIFYYESTNEPVTTAEWMTNLVEDLLAHLYKKRYLLVIDEHRFTEKLLNHLYLFERDYLNGSVSRLYNTTPHRNDDYEFLFNVKCPDDFWKKLANDNAIEWFADGDEFALRVWIELPFWVAQYIDFINSVATKELNSLLAGTDVEEEMNNEESKKKDPDPYVQDYYY